MKDKLTLRNLLICIGGFFGILVFIFSFLPAVRYTNAMADAEYLHILWGADAVKNMANGKVEPLQGADKLGPSVLALVGTILVILGTVCAIVMIFLGEKIFKDEKIRKIVLFVAGGLIVLGGIFTFFTLEGFYSEVAKKAGITVEQYKKQLEAANTTVSCGLPIVSGILAILGGGAVIGSQFIPDKKLGK